MSASNNLIACCSQVSSLVISVANRFLIRFVVACGTIVYATFSEIAGITVYESGSSGNPEVMVKGELH